MRGTQWWFSHLRKGRSAFVLLLLLVVASSVVPCNGSNNWFWRRWWVSLRAGSNSSNSKTTEASRQGTEASPAANTAATTTTTATTSMSTILSPASAIYNSFARNQSAAADETSKGLWSTSRRMTSKRIQFLERMALIMSSSSSQQQAATARNGTAEDGTVADLMQRYNATDISTVTPDSDLSRPGRTIHIVTTAALPWFTGTAVNPLLRAAYLHRYTRQINNNNNNCSNSNDNATTASTTNYVTLVIPWLELDDDQTNLYGRVFDSEAAQEAYIRQWLHDDAGMADVASELQILFYPARYHAGLGSIFAMGDIIEAISSDSSSGGGDVVNSNNTDHGGGSDSMDVCILEEPEHCNWYRAPGDSWMQRFNFVVGIVHTSEYTSFLLFL
jgi:hypothetical protein